uniref:Uncharacterized protein n=1 Tax=Rhizophora mucronata TaxID=61149 RepID=A0A2P2L683_RHIMU
MRAKYLLFLLLGREVHENYSEWGIQIRKRKTISYAKRKKKKSMNFQQKILV